MRLQTNDLELMEFGTVIQFSRLNSNKRFREYVFQVGGKAKLYSLY